MQKILGFQDGRNDIVFQTMNATKAGGNRECRIRFKEVDIKVFLM